MRIAFYAPMKSPAHPAPSGDRRVARQLVAALKLAGFQVDIASEFRSYEGRGEKSVQQAIRQQGRQQASELLASYRDGKLPPPDIWFTYHLYHKAPDWIGPQVSAELGIPYLLAEASYAGKQRGGPWDLGLRASQQAIEAAAAVVSFNPVDDACVAPWLGEGAQILSLAPFIDTSAYTEAAAQRLSHRNQTARRFGLDSSLPWLLCVAMMRPGDKLHSYQILASSLASLLDRRWQLLVVGDGETQDQVKAAFAGIDDRVSWLGRLTDEALPPIYAASDLYVWPAVGEAFGMALVEARASGLAVIAGNYGGVAGVVEAPHGGILVDPVNPHSFACAVRQLLDEPELIRQMADWNKNETATKHGLAGAAMILKNLINEIVACRS